MLICRSAGGSVNYSVILDWHDNTEEDLAGYNVYRSNTPNSYGNPIAAGVQASEYSDTVTADGTTYYYVVRAVDESGNESVNSNEASLYLPVDSDTDGIDDNWELHYFGNLFSSSELSDTDADGVKDFFEYLFGSDPTSASSRGGVVANVNNQDGTSMVFRWVVKEHLTLGADYGFSISPDMGSWLSPLPEDYSAVEYSENGMTHVTLEIASDYGNKVFLVLTKP